MEMTLIVMLGTALFATIGILGGAVFGFRGQISGVHAEIGKVRGEITGLATHADIATLETSLRGEIAGLATHADIARLEERFGHLEARLDEHLRVHV
jgi:hypothetical protein